MHTGTDPFVLCKSQMKKDSDILNTADIPYEVRMKYIIKAYREDQEKWGKLEVYAKQLEAEVIRLKNILTVNGYADTGNPEDAKTAKVISELQTKVAEQEKKMKTLARDLRDSEIKRLKKLIKEEYPLRAVKLKKIRDVVRAQKEYIEELQALLEKNDIVYWPMEPADEKDIVEIENAIDIKAVRVPQDLEQTPKINKVEI